MNFWTFLDRNWVGIVIIVVVFILFGSNPGCINSCEVTRSGIHIGGATK